MLALYELVLFENCYKISLIVDSYGIPNSIYVDSGNINDAKMGKNFFKNSAQLSFLNKKVGRV